MVKPSPTTSDAHWTSLAQQLIVAISDLFTIYSQEQTPTADTALILNSDFSRLLSSAHKLEKLSTQPEPDPSQDRRLFLHDIRNILGTIKGYCELIQEECEEQQYGLIGERLNNILKLCTELLLRHDNKTDTTIFRTKELNALGEKQVNTTQDIATKGVIVVVDDQSESRALLARHLAQGQYTVLEAESAVELFNILNTHDADLILLDLVLPEMDGFEILSWLKKHKSWQAIPVIIVSGHQDEEGVIRCIEAGADDYLLKPFNPIILQARINAGLQRKDWHNREQRYRQELERNQRFIRSVFGRYVSDEIVDTLLENDGGLDLGGNQRKVTVLMADIRGFTTICETLPPQRVVRLLNHYLGAMTEIIQRHNGIVDEFIGDAILAIFGAPTSREDDTERAVQCALDMQTAMAAINHVNNEEKLPEISIGVTLNTGPVIAGNIGSEKRAKYGVVGHTVNQTARLEEQCPGGTVLISETTLKDSKLALLLGKKKTIQAKGIHHPLHAYEVIGIETTRGPQGKRHL